MSSLRCGPATSGRSRVVALLLFLLGAFALAGPAFGTLTNSTTAVEQDPALVGTALTPADAPSLTESDVAQARRLVDQDGHLKALLVGQSYVIGDVTVWTRSDDKSRDKLGAVVHLHLARPAKLTGRWPAMTYDASERSTPPYEAGEVQQTVDAVSDLYVLVDLTGARVVHLQPGPGSGTADPPAVLGSSPSEG